VYFTGAAGKVSKQVAASRTSEVSSAEMSRQPRGPTGCSGAWMWNANGKADGVG